MKGMVRLVVLTVGLAATLAVPARADRYVSTQGSDTGNTCASSSSPCKTIGAALAAAGSGEVVNIAVGTYKEANVISPLGAFTLTLQGGWDSSFTTLNVTVNKTVLSGGKTDRALRIESDSASTQTVTLDGLTVEKSTAKSPDSFGENAGGGVLAESHGTSQLTLNIDQVVFNKNKSTPGGGALRILGLDASNLAVNIADSTFIKNKAGGEGGAIEADSENDLTVLTIDRTRFEKNKGSSKSGGALDTESRGGNFEVTLDRVTFVKNKAGAEGGGAIQGEANEGQLEYHVTNCAFVKNKAVGPGGGFQFRAQDAGIGGSVEIVNATFTGNNSSMAGGGIYLSAESGSPLTVSLINSIVRGNHGKDGADVHGVGADLDATAGYDNVGEANNVPYKDLGGHRNVDPQLQDPAAGDVHLKAGSPMIDAGSCTYAPSHDVDGQPRPVGGGCDIGADEYMVP